MGPRSIAAVLPVLAIAACGVEIVDINSIDRKDLDIPIPLVEQLPITVGVLYDEKLRNHHQIDEYGLGEIKFEYHLGPPSVALFDPLFSAMFQEVVSVDDASTERVDGQELSAILSLSIDRFIGPNVESLSRKTSAFGAPTMVAHIRYSLSLYAPPGKKRITISAENSHDRGHGSVWIHTAVARAMRNAAVELFVKFNNDSAVMDWMASHAVPGAGTETKSR